MALGDGLYVLEECPREDMADGLRIMRSMEVLVWDDPRKCWRYLWRALPPPPPHVERKLGPHGIPNHDEDEARRIRAYVAVGESSVWVSPT